MREPEPESTAMKAKAVAVSAQTVLLSWMRGLFRKGGSEAGARMRLSRWMKWLWGKAPAQDDPEATEEFATMSSFTLLPGQLKLRVGVVSVRGNYRDHNEDNFYVPGRRSVRHDSNSDSQANQSTMTLETSNLFIVADGMCGQQAGE